MLKLAQPCACDYEPSCLASLGTLSTGIWDSKAAVGCYSGEGRKGKGGKKGGKKGGGWRKTESVAVEVSGGGRREKRAEGGSGVVPMMELYPMSFLNMICDPSTRRLGAMIKRQWLNRLPINYPEEQQHSPSHYQVPTSHPSPHLIRFARSPADP